MVEKDPNDRNDRVLAGLRVVELGRHIAGPFCAQMLGDAGADVIKVESPRGDPGRLVAPFAGPTSLYFVNFNRNKRSIALDLRTAEGRGILVDLIAQADVFVHNYRPGVVEQLGVDVAALHDVNPGLIGVGISGFGREGPYAEQPAYDDVLQAMSGLMSLTGFADGPPLIVGAPIIDCTTGLYAFTAVLLGLAQRSQTGKGSVLSVSMLDCAMSLVNWSYSRYLTTGEVDNRSGNQNRYYACIGTHRTRDGYVQIIADTDAAWRALAELMGRSDLAEDGRLRTAEGRADAKDEVAAAIDDWAVTMTTAEVVETLWDHPVFATPVRTVADVAADGDVSESGRLVNAMAANGGYIPTPAFPVRFEQSARGDPLAPPKIGEHTAEVLHEVLGYRHERIAALLERRIVAVATEESIGAAR
jgi:CoA:oxalate CoA-transferase